MPIQKGPNLGKKPSAPPTYEPKPEWLNGAEGFFNWCEDVKPRILNDERKYVPFVPEPWQRKAIEKTLAVDSNGDFGNDITLLIAPRRHGKSAINALIVLWLTTTRENHVTHALGNTEDHCNRVQMKPIKGIIRNTPKLLEWIPERHITAQFITMPVLNSTIQMSAVNMANAFGDKISLLWVSDFHECPDIGPFWAYQASLLDTKNSLCLIDSNPDTEGGHVHQFEQAAKDDPKIAIHRIQYENLEDYCENAPSWLPRHKARRAAVVAPENEFKRDYLGKRTNPVNALFPPEKIKACMKRYSYPVEAASLGGFFNGGKYVIGGGFDWASNDAKFSTDLPAFTIVGKHASLDDGEPNYWVLHQEADKDADFKRQKEWIANAHRQYKMTNLVLESPGTQPLFSWACDQNIPVERPSPTSSLQYSIFMELHGLVATGRLHFPEGMKELESELRTFQYDNSGTVPKFGHPKKGGVFHDDRVYSLAWAIWGLRDHELVNYELPLFHCESKNRLQQFCYLRGGTEVLSCGDYCEGHYHCRQMYNQYKAVHPSTELNLPEFHASKVKSKGGGAIVSIT